MTRDEINKRFSENSNDPIIVEHKRSKKQYVICWDVGGLSDLTDQNPYIYGEPVSGRFEIRIEVKVDVVKQRKLRLRLSGLASGVAPSRESNHHKRGFDLSQKWRLNIGCKMGKKLEATDEQLIEALNLCCEHVTDRLPDGYEIRISMSSKECTMNLIDPDGEDVEFCVEAGVSGLNTAITAATNDDPYAEAKAAFEDGELEWGSPITGVFVDWQGDEEPLWRLSPEWYRRKSSKTDE